MLSLSLIDIYQMTSQCQSYDHSKFPVGGLHVTS